MLHSRRAPQQRLKELERLELEEQDLEEELGQLERLELEELDLRLALGELDLELELGQVEDTCNDRPSMRSAYRIPLGKGREPLLD